MFEGVHTAIVTPFRDGKVDYDRLGKQIDRQIEGGCGLLPCGTTGENPTLSTAEQKEVIRFTCERASGRAKVIAGAGNNCTADTVELVAHAKACGADGALVITPYYNKPGERGIKAHVEAAAAAADIPLVLYNVPGRTAINMSCEFLAELAAIDNVVAVKDATGDVARVSKLRALAPGLEVLSGEDSIAMPLVAVGGLGVISVTSNVAPAEMSAMIRHALAGELAEALALHQRLFALAEAMFIDTNPIPVKTALRLLELDSGEVRLPLVPPTAQVEAAVRSALVDFGMLDG